VLAVRCVSPAAALVACRDRRVDVVFFDTSRRNIRFNYTYADLLHGALEFNVASELLNASSSDIYMRLAKEAAIARKSNTKIVLSSGATKPELLRSPMQVSGLGGAIGLSKVQVLEGVAETPTSIVRRNMERRSSSYIEEGVRVITPRGR
jgi:RNase P/RNase MRP subunit p30